MAFSWVAEGGRGRLDAALFGAFLLLLIWLPIPLGSNRAWAISAFEVATFVLVAAWLLLWAFGRAEASDPLRRSWPALALLAAWLGLLVVHIVPLPTGVVGFLSPEAGRMHALADSVAGARSRWTISVDPHASKLFLLRSLALAGVLFLTLALVNRRSRLQILAQVLVYAALAHSVAAVLLHLGGVELQLFGTRVSHGMQASGTYVNRNHFAGFLEMMLAIGIGLLIAGLSDRRADSWRQFLRHTLDWMLSPKMVLRLTLCVLVIALTTTHSRMGNTGFFASLLVTGVIGIALSRHATRNTVLLLTSLVVIDLAIVGSWFGVERLAERIEATTRQEVMQREVPAAHTLPLIRDYALLGAGGGTFYVTFENYRPETVRDFYDYAHNDYAQFASETGLLGIGILGLLVAGSLGAALRAQWVRRDPLMRGMSFACVMGVTAILIHSTADFNLQIPANAAYFMVLLALGWISLHHDRVDSRPRGNDEDRIRE